MTDLGIEVYGGYTANLALGRGELQEQIGGNYEISKGLTVDFGAITGQAVGSPHYGFQIGFRKTSEPEGDQPGLNLEQG